MDLHREPWHDVKSKRCGFEGCTVRAWYGTPGIGPEKCAEHRLAGMSTRPNARCNVCKEPATRGSADGKPVRCAGHSLPGDLNLVERRCAECGLLWVLDRRGYCEYCQPAVFKRARLAKQRDLTDYLDSRGLPGAQTDRIVDGGECGMERPDRVYPDPEGRFVLILEIDENQHRDRACECEQTRMVNIGQAFGGTPVYFVRWNPDTYVPGGRGETGGVREAGETEEGEVREAGETEEGVNGKPARLRTRHETVAELIEGILSGRLFRDTQPVPGALVCALYMYYDGFVDLYREPWHCIS